MSTSSSLLFLLRGGHPLQLQRQRQWQRQLWRPTPYSSASFFWLIPKTASSSNTSSSTSCLLSSLSFFSRSHHYGCYRGQQPQPHPQPSQVQPPHPPPHHPGFGRGVGVEVLVVSGNGNIHHNHHHYGRNHHHTSIERLWKNGGQGGAGRQQPSPSSSRRSIHHLLGGGGGGGRRRRRRRRSSQGTTRPSSTRTRSDRTTTTSDRRSIRTTTGRASALDPSKSSSRSALMSEFFKKQREVGAGAGAGEGEGGREGKEYGSFEAEPRFLPPSSSFFRGGDNDDDNGNYNDNRGNVDADRGDQDGFDNTYFFNSIYGSADDEVGMMMTGGNKNDSNVNDDDDDDDDDDHDDDQHEKIERQKWSSNPYHNDPSVFRASSYYYWHEGDFDGKNLDYDGNDSDDYEYADDDDDDDDEYADDDDDDDDEDDDDDDDDDEEGEMENDDDDEEEEEDEFESDQIAGDTSDDDDEEDEEADPPEEMTEKRLNEIYKELDEFGEPYTAIQSDKEARSFDHDSVFVKYNDLSYFATETEGNGSMGKDLIPDKITSVPVMPLRPHGPEIDDFLEAVLYHPTKYAQITSCRLHPDSKREPKPIFPKNRLQPSTKFVNSHKRFLYVCHLSPSLLEVVDDDNIENTTTDNVNNDLDKHQDNNNKMKLLQRLIAEQLEVHVSDVFPTSPTSAFIGFHQSLNDDGIEDAVQRCYELLTTSDPLILAPYEGEIPQSFARMNDDNDHDDDGGDNDHDHHNDNEHDDDDDDHDDDDHDNDHDVVLELSNIPNEIVTELDLIQALFPSGSKVEAVYGEDVTVSDIHFLEPNRALVRFASQEQASSALESRLLEEQLHAVRTQYTPRIYKARRELVHAGWYGLGKDEEQRILGPKLIVDGDMPSQRLYISHAAVIHVRNLDTTQITPAELSAAFDKYCVGGRQRDVAGSIEFVTCEAGEPNGFAYVGFDTIGEAEAAIKDLGGGLTLGSTTTRAYLKLVKDRRIPGLPVHATVEKRSERSIDEILDELNNWEKYVNPEDLKTLEKHGISKIILDETFRNIRFKNKTFGALDSTVRYEAIEPDKKSGELYRELVPMYISTLLECLVSEDNVGVTYELTHFPDEELDLSIFETEKVRQKKLLGKRAIPAR